MKIYIRSSKEVSPYRRSKIAETSKDPEELRLLANDARK